MCGKLKRDNYPAYSSNSPVYNIWNKLFLTVLTLVKNSAKI